MKLFRKLTLEPIHSHSQEIVLVVSIIIFIEEIEGEGIEERVRINCLRCTRKESGEIFE